MKKLVPIFLIFIVYLSSAADKNSVFKEVKAKYSNPESVSMNFAMEGNSSVSGKIIASEDNKYRITVPGRIITCNGKTIWNYSNDDANVIISNFQSHSENASPERIFFDVMDGYEPVSLKKVSSTTGASNYELALKPIKEKIADMSKIVLYLDRDNQIIKVGIESLYGFEVWKVSNLKVNIPLAESEFVFNPPEGTEIIDLR